MTDRKKPTSHRVLIHCVVVVGLFGALLFFTIRGASPVHRVTLESAGRQVGVSADGKWVVVDRRVRGADGKFPAEDIASFVLVNSASGRELPIDSPEAAGVPFRTSFLRHSFEIHRTIIIRKTWTSAGVEVKIIDRSTGTERLHIPRVSDAVMYHMDNFQIDTAEQRVACISSPVGNNDFRPHVYDLQTGEELFVIKEVDGDRLLSPIAMTADGRYIATVSYPAAPEGKDDRDYRRPTRDIRIFEIDSGEGVCHITKAHRDPGRTDFLYGITSLEFSPDGERLACASNGRHRNGATGNDAHVIVFHTESGKRLVELPVLTEMKKLRFSPDGQRLQASMMLLASPVWDLTSQTGKPVSTGFSTDGIASPMLAMAGHTDVPVESEHTSPALRWKSLYKVLNGSGTLTFTDLSSPGETIAGPVPMAGTTAGFLYSADEEQVVVASFTKDSSKLAVFDLSRQQSLGTLSGREPVYVDSETLITTRFPGGQSVVIETWRLPFTLHRILLIAGWVAWSFLVLRLIVQHRRPATLSADTKGR